MNDKRAGICGLSGPDLPARVHAQGSTRPLERPGRPIEQSERLGGTWKGYRDSGGQPSLPAGATLKIARTGSPGSGRGSPAFRLAFGAYFTYDNPPYRRRSSGVLGERRSRRRPQVLLDREQPGVQAVLHDVDAGFDADKPSFHAVEASDQEGKDGETTASSATPVPRVHFASVLMANMVPLRRRWFQARALDRPAREKNPARSS